MDYVAKEHVATTVTGRSKNRGASKRQSYSVAFKAQVLNDYDAWEAAQTKAGKSASIREFVKVRSLGRKFEKFLSTGGWRDPETQKRIMEDAARAEYQHVVKMHDRSKSKSHYAEMEVALTKRIEECLQRGEVITQQAVQDMAREELRRLTNNDEEKVKAFKASAGWVTKFLQRLKRQAAEEQFQRKKRARLKRDSPVAPDEESVEEASGGPNAPSEDGGSDYHDTMDNSDDDD
jgi:hypothetical protein